jgi:hypothetical protein
MKRILFLSVFFAFSGSMIKAQNCNWQGIDSNWNNPANWSCGRVPGVADTVVVGSGLVHYPKLNGSLGVLDYAAIAAFKCKKFTLASGASLSFTAGLLQTAGVCDINGTVWGGGIEAYGGFNYPNSRLTLNGASLYGGTGLYVFYFFPGISFVTVTNSYIEGGGSVNSTEPTSPHYGNINGSTFVGNMYMSGSMSGGNNLVRLRGTPGPYNPFDGSFLTFAECLGQCTYGSGEMGFSVQNDTPQDDTVTVQLGPGVSLRGNIVFNTNNPCGIMRIRRRASDDAYAGSLPPYFGASLTDTILIQGNLTIANKGYVIFNDPYKITGTITLNGGRIIKAWKGAVNTFPPGDTLRCPLNFGLGTINLSAGKLYTERTITADSFSNVSASNYMVTTAPLGKLKQSVKLYPKLFPVGNNASYTPAVLKNTNSFESFSVQVQQGVYSNGSSGAQFTNKVVDRTWFIDKQWPGSSNTDLTLQWNAADELPGFVRSNCNLAHYNGSYWEGGVSTVASGADPYTITRTGLTSFSPFSVGRQGVLASDCHNFTGASTANGIVLRWQLVPDGQQHQYFLQRSSDGVNFINISRIETGSGSYSFIDKAYSNGANYYRIMQTTANAPAQQLCRIIEVAGKRNQSIVNLLGNPVGNSLQLSISSLFNQQVSFEIIGADGRRAGNWVQTVPNGTNTITLPVNKLAPGIYLLKVVGQDVQSVSRFMKR